MLCLDEKWWGGMSVMVYRTFLGDRSALPVQFAVVDIRTRADASVERSIATVGRAQLASGTGTQQRDLNRLRLRM
jgi:hypothetical protein